MGYKKKQNGPMKRKKKLVIDFDEGARKEYLTGFQKRRQQRKDKAQKDLNEKLKKQIREERTKRKKAAKDHMVSILKGAGLLDEDLDEEDDSKKVVDFGSHEVIVTTNIDYNESGLSIGTNQSGDVSTSINNKEKKKIAHSSKQSSQSKYHKKKKHRNK